jgi:hypothetical protein
MAAIHRPDQLVGDTAEATKSYVLLSAPHLPLPPGWMVARWLDGWAVAVSPGSRKDVQSLRPLASPSFKEAIFKAMLVLD